MLLLVTPDLEEIHAGGRGEGDSPELLLAHLCVEKLHSESISDFSEERGNMNLQKWKISLLSHLKPSHPR